MIHDEFGQYLKLASMRVFEPAWKMLLSNKALLPLLWELYPGHPNLLPAYFNVDQRLGDSSVKKPIYSREGNNILINNQGSLTQTYGEYGEEGFIFQQYSQ